MSEALPSLRAEPLRRFKRYPAYKDSGVEWLGEIPAHWDVKRLKHIASLNADALPEATDPALEMTYVDIGGVDSLGRIIEQENLTFASAPTRARRLVRDGDVIVSTVRTYLRAIAPIKNPQPGMVVSTGFAVVRPDDDLTTGYAAYVLRAPYFVERVVANSKGVSFPAINESEMATYELTLPPEPEQRAIAAFLDRETARIDVLVAKKERLIELLQEKRTALITRAVTKGLDPTVPMKDSGVEWLGQIPAHWEVKGNGGLFDERNERGRDDLPILEVSIAAGVRIRTFSDTKIEQRSDKLEAYKVTRTGDIAFNKMRMWQGAVGATPEDGLVSPDYIVAQPRSTTVPAYFASVFRIPLYMAEVYRWSHGIVDDRNRLYWDDFKAIRTPVPPTSEQRAITEFLDRETARIDALTAKVRDAIDRLKELRTALISAAVTGKIDVREEAAG